MIVDARIGEGRVCAALEAARRERKRNGKVEDKIVRLFLLISLCPARDVCHCVLLEVMLRIARRYHKIGYYKIEVDQKLVLTFLFSGPVEASRAVKM